MERGWGRATYIYLPMDYTRALRESTGNPYPDTIYTALMLRMEVLGLAS